MSWSFETAGPVAVQVKSPAGRVDVEAIDGTTTEVELTALDDHDGTREAIAAATVEHRTENGVDRIVVDVPRRRRWALSGGAGVLVHVRCPLGSDLEVRSASADVETQGRLGAVKVDTASGDIRVDEADGETVLRSASGDVAIGTARGEAQVDTASGDIRAGAFEADGRIRTASGDVMVEAAGGSLTVQSASGDQQVDAVRSGSVSLQTASGDIRICVQRGSSLRLDARSMSGDLTSEIELGDEPVPGADDDGPHVHVKAISMSGDVRIERAGVA
jgi:hypothetical protein